MQAAAAPRTLEPCDENSAAQRLLSRKRLRVPSLSGGATNVYMQEHSIDREARASILGKHPGFRGCTIWFTGLSGAGKTTISFALEKALTQVGIPCYGLDGDNVRHGLCKNLGFSKEERSENIRRVAEVSKLFADMGVICLASFISPFRSDREEARRIHQEGNIPFFEVHVNTSLEVCEARDPKKLYKKARAGQIIGFTGIDSAYEPPENADLVLEAGEESCAESVRRVLQQLMDAQLLPEKAMHELTGPPVRELFVAAESRVALAAEAATLPRVDMGLVDVQWMQVLAEGWATPLSGFMRERQYLQSLYFRQLIDLKTQCVFPGDKETGKEDPYPMGDHVNQSIPIVLPLNDDQKAAIVKDGAVSPAVALYFNGKPVAVLRDGEVFAHNKERRICYQFGFSDSRHPTIEQIRASGDWCLGGDIEVIDRIRFDDGLDAFRKTPLEIREEMAAKGADVVFAFQLRNPIHNGHALLMRDTREKLLARGFKNPMLLLHPLGGWTKDDDVPLATRIQQHEAVMEEGVLDPSWTVLSIFPSPMLYAGPIEVQWHARARIAAGANTYIVGRDPAGIAHPDTGDFLYEPTYGAKVLSMAPGLSQLDILPFRVAAYDKKAGQMAFFDPARKDDFDFISGTRMRGLARSGATPPDGFMAPKAWTVLANYYKNKAAEQQQ